MLKDEFSTKIDSALLHQMLSEKMMKKGEKLQEYYLIFNNERISSNRNDRGIDTIYHLWHSGRRTK